MLITYKYIVKILLLMQNIAVNGARSGAVLRNSESLVRNQTIDHPVLLVLELIGNDVCTPHHTFDRVSPNN